MVRSSIPEAGDPDGFGGFPSRGKTNRINVARIKPVRRSDTVVKNGNTDSKEKGIIRIIATNNNIKAALFSFSPIDIIMAPRNITDKIIPKEIRIFCNIPGVSFYSKIQKLNVFATFLNINRLLSVE